MFIILLILFIILLLILILNKFRIIDKFTLAKRVILKIGIKHATFGEYFAHRFFNNYIKIYKISELDILSALNKYEIDLGVVSLESYFYFSKLKANNIRFIASLVYSYINILAINDININLSYKQNYDRKYIINVLYKNSVHHFVCKKILNYLNINEYFTYVFNEEEYLDNYDILFYIGVHPSIYLKNLYNYKTLHYINLIIDNPKEDKFVKTNIAYFEDLLNINDLKKYYPNLTIINKNINYIKTLKTIYILCSNNKTPFTKKNMYDFFNTKKQIIYNNEPYFNVMNEISLVLTGFNFYIIPFNIGAKEYYSEIKLHNTNLDWDSNIPPTIPPLVLINNTK